jgi:hypothetical protein
MPASRQASEADLPCAINTPIWRSSVMICSGVEPLLRHDQSSFPTHFLTSLGLEKADQVSGRCALWHDCSSDFKNI